jgi:serine/threonine protein kinase
MNGYKGFGKVYWYGTQDDQNILVTEYLGSNLNELQNHVNGKFSLETTYKLAIQLLSILEVLH